jgi:cytochrome c-type biogenesis protein CcmH
MRSAVVMAWLLVSLSASPTFALATSRQAEKPTSGVASQQTVADADLETRTAAVAATLRCPVCQGESIQDSPAELAQQMRAIVRDKLRAGETPEQIRGYFMARYGEWILLEPRKTGLNLLLYVLPVALVVGGLVIVTLLVKRWTAPEPNAPQP